MAILKKSASLIFFAYFIILSHCTRAQEVLFEVRASKFLMGTKFDIVAVYSSVDSCKRIMYYAFKEVERIEHVMSSATETSEIHLINQNAGGKRVKVSFETFSIIRRSVDYSKQYGGLFDISIGPISELWGFNSEHPVTKVPDEKIIDSLVKLVDYKEITLDESDTSVFLRKPQMNLDLGGIAKGYAIDRAAMILREKGIRNFMVNGGGDVYVSGYKQDSTRWVIGIEHPRDKNRIIGRLELTDFALGTSGDYERYAFLDGKRYHHIFDPRTGFPAPLSQSSSAIASTAEEAVVLSKYLFIIGTNGYKEILDKSPIKGVIVDSSGKIFYDRRLEMESNFQLIN